METNLIPSNSFVQVMEIAFQNPLVVSKQTQVVPGHTKSQSTHSIFYKSTDSSETENMLTVSGEGTFQLSEYAQFLEAKISPHL